MTLLELKEFARDLASLDLEPDEIQMLNHIDQITEYDEETYQAIDRLISELTVR